MRYGRRSCSRRRSHHRRRRVRRGRGLMNWMKKAGRFLKKHATLANAKMAYGYARKYKSHLPASVQKVINGIDTVTGKGYRRRRRRIRGRGLYIR